MMKFTSEEDMRQWFATEISNALDQIFLIQDDPEAIAHWLETGELPQLQKDVAQ
jgi:hypothetical protein